MVIQSRAMVLRHIVSVERLERLFKQLTGMGQYQWAPPTASTSLLDLRTEVTQLAQNRDFAFRLPRPVLLYNSSSK